MKKLLLPLIVLTVLVSCGKKDNKVASDQATTVFNPIYSTTAGASQLGTLVDNYTTSFGTGQVYYYGQIRTLQTLANYRENIAYRYTKGTKTVAGANCEKKWGFTICKYSSKNTASEAPLNESKIVYNNDVDITAKANQLKAIINNARPLIGIETNGTAHLIRATDGYSYIIDTSFPLQANPIGIMNNAQTEVEYLYNITES